MSVALGLAFVAVGCRARVEPSAARAPGPSRGAGVRAPDEVIPFRPVPDEAVPVQPCGGVKAACPLLGWEGVSWAWGYEHLAWFMDTAGNEYELSFSDKDKDLLDVIESDSLITASEFARVVAAAKALPRRVTAAEARHALALLVASRSGSLETLQIPVCNDGGSSQIDGYLYEPQWKGYAARRLERSECAALPAERNDSRAARELTQWIGKIRQARAAERGRK